MNFVAVLGGYLSVNLLLICAAASLFFAEIIFKFFQISEAVKLKLHYAVILSVGAVTVALPIIPAPDLFQPIAKVWSVIETSSPEMIGSVGQGYIAAAGSARQVVTITQGGEIFVFAFVGLFCLGFSKLFWDLRRLSRLRKKSFLVRKLYRTSIYVNHEVIIPFSFWTFSGNHVVVPSQLLSSAHYRTAVLHEIQHHRQGDTRWVYVVWILKTFFILNPVIHIWNRWLSRIQEFACDEILVGQNKVESRAYATCLLHVAQLVTHDERLPVCATGLAFLVDRLTIKRRIQKMLEVKKTKFGWKPAVVAGILITGLLGLTAYASQDLLQDRRITMQQAMHMAQVAQKDSKFPIVLNDRVLKWLNFYLGTPDGRQRMQQVLVRMENYRPVIEKKLNDYQAPYELLAVPFIESGYQNLGPERNRYRAAGLWQFIASTAVKFGLKVNTTVDERLNVDLATDAAIRMLLGDQLRFKNWLLSALSYNAGETAVQTAIDKSGSRDVWTLINGPGFSNESVDYVPKLMAAILIIKNPATAE